LTDKQTEYSIFYFYFRPHTNNTQRKNMLCKKKVVVEDNKDELN